MRLFSRALLTLAAVTVAASAQAASIAGDNAGNYTSWTNGTNGGTGFGAWDLTSNNSNGSSLFAGYFLGDSTAGTGNINTGGQSFGVYANPNGAYAVANRSFSSALSVGQTFSIQLAVNFRNGDKGINLLSSGTQVFNFDVGTSGSSTDGYYYSVGNNTATNTGFTYYSDSVFTLSYLQQTPAGAQVTISRTSASGGAAAANSVTVPFSNNSLTSFALYNSNTGSSDNANNLYFNNLAVVPEPSVCVLAALGGTALVTFRRRRNP